MSTILPIDTNLVFPSTVVVSASAGSGKTYTLTQRLVQLLISDHVPNNGLRNILAITFTNQAAAEMRSRLIDYLKRLSLGDPDLVAEAGEYLSMSPGRIREKADTVLLRILNDFSDLQIRTIDSFMATVFKTSAFEFGHQPNLDIVFDNRPLLAEAFARLTRQLHADPTLRETLRATVRLIQETRSNRSGFLWDPYGRIEWEVKNLYSRLAAREHEVISGGGLAEGDRLKKELSAQAGRFRQALEESRLEPQSKVLKDLADAEAHHAERLLTRTRIAEEKIVKKPKGGVHASRLEAAAESLAVELRKFNDALDRYVYWYARNHFQPYIDATNFVRSTLEQLKREKGEIFIDDINRLLLPHLQESGAVDAYLMLGEQIYHFLIDEFQDTSPIQWANLRPLIENSLSQGGSLFVVGDRKQSIYGFRGADWKIMDRLMREEVFPAAKAEVRSLDDNWRSHENIILYVSHVFEETVARSSFAEPATLSGLDSVKQKPLEEHRNKGVVEVMQIDYDEESTPERSELLTLIRDCLRRGYGYRDIAILTAQNERVLEISTWLNQEGIPVLPFSSLDIRSRTVIGEILALLRFLDSPVDDLSFATFLAGDLFLANLQRDGSSSQGPGIHDFLMSTAQKPRHRRLYISFRNEHHPLWSTYFEELFRLVGYLPLYDLLSELYRRFRVFDVFRKEEASLVRLLEVVRAFGESDRNSVRDFLEMAGEEGEQSSWQVQVPGEVEAVRVMTVHKSKGLEFPVSIVVSYDRDLRSSRYFFHDSDSGTSLLNISSGAAKNHPGLDAIYRSQKKADQVDSLNKLYVSLTRARHELFAIALRGIRDPFFPSQLLDPPPGQIEMRPPADVDRRPARQPLDIIHTMEPVTYEESGFRRAALPEMARGEFIHAVLARIRLIEADVEPTVDQSLALFQSEMPAGIDPSEVRRSLVQFLSTAGVEELFRRTEGRSVEVEKEFVARDGSLHRMDRVILDPNAVTVVDFKTGGRPVAEYREQMAIYGGILRDIYPGLTCHTVVAYVDQCRVERLR
ncbi:MAG: UvrD-helicase domain-containing protein [Ignavibacteria bacterium]|nr:UvrD-helicase domain-containing protein [Ignavibacteria bacterium]